MKIISYNICIKIDNNLLIAKYLKEQKADIICLQEVVRPLSPKVYPLYRSEEVIREFLSADYPYYFFAPEWVADKHIGVKGLKDFGGMVEQGKLILSKYPILHGYNYFFNKAYEFDCDRMNFYNGDDHGRTLQVCEIDIKGKIIQVGNIHGLYSADKLDTERSIEQSRFVLKKMQMKNFPTILLGDFNVRPETESIAIIDNCYNNINKAFNIQSTILEGLMIDFIFLSDDLSAKSMSVEKIELSDHYPLVVEIKDL